jgi:hypothetical protein
LKQRHFCCRDYGVGALDEKWEVSLRLSSMKNGDFPYFSICLVKNVMVNSD